MIKRRNLHIMLLGAVILLLLGACKNDDSTSDQDGKSHTIAVLVQTTVLLPYLEGFKVGMAEQGYVEGETITYLYDGPTNTIEALQPEAEKLKSQNPDLVFSIGGPAAHVAQDKFADTNVPIIFAPVVNPVGEGLVESRNKPGKNMTGIEPPDTNAKLLEKLLQVMPDVKRIYVPMDPNDAGATATLPSLVEAAKLLNLELVVVEGSTQEELDTITQTIPENIDAIIQPRSGTIGARLNNLVEAATKRGIPVVISYVGSGIDLGVMLGYGPDSFEAGKQAAHLADQILKGADVSTLPVEYAEVYLGINLKTAQAIDVEISNTILSEAKQIVRPDTD